MGTSAASSDEGAACAAYRMAGAGALTTSQDAGGTLTTTGPMRTSDLLAPIMLLSGHSGPVNTIKFSPDGRHLLSGGHDKTILLWEVFGECKNTLTFRGHGNSVLE